MTPSQMPLNAAVIYAQSKQDGASAVLSVWGHNELIFNDKNVITQSKKINEQDGSIPIDGVDVDYVILKKSAALKSGKESEFSEIKIDDDDLNEVFFNQIKKNGGDDWKAFVAANNGDEPDEADDLLELMPSLDEGTSKKVQESFVNLRNRVSEKIKQSNPDFQPITATVNQIKSSSNNIFVINDKSTKNDGCESLKLLGVFKFPL